MIRSAHSSGKVIAFAIGIGAWVSVCACKGSGDAAPAPSASAASVAPAGSLPSSSASTSLALAPIASALPPLRNRPASDAELATTSPNIFLSNMQGQLREAERLAKQFPTNPMHCRALSGEYYAHGKFDGDLDLIQKGILVMQQRCLAMDPKNADLYVDLAGEVQTLHRFKEARAHLARAKELGAKPELTAPLETELDWNDGLYDKAIPAIRAARLASPTLMTVAREAQLEHDLGHMAEAERGFEAAEKLLRDTSPVPLAWLYMQHGMHDVHVGNLERAIVFFRAAIERIPNLAEREHLAEALAMVGQDDEATRIYEDIVKTSTDPEFMGALAKLHRKHGRAKEADALRAKATARYGELLAKYPEAMYWHASEYFLGEGNDPKRARDLLKKNVELRPNSASWVALARAELAAGDPAAARIAIDKALAMPLVSSELWLTASRVYGAHEKSDAAKAKDFLAKAKALNPRAEQDE